MNKTAVVTGGSSGIGRATAALLAKEGWTVFEFSRRDVPQSGVTHIYADITKPETVSEAVGRVVSESGGIDMLINNAGSGISGAIEFTEGIEVEFSVKTLFVGMDTVTRCCLPHIRKARGRIVCISSAAAVLPVPFQTYYSAMKAAVNAYTMSLANEVRRFGVSVCAVMPGGHPFGHICIFFQLLIGCLKLVVELIDFFNGTTLHINNINAVDDKQNNIQRNDNIENAEQILLRTGRIISDVV